MQQKYIWTNFLKRMNKINFAAITIGVMCLSCTVDRIYTYSATTYLINESSVVVKSDNTLGYIMQPGDTIIHKDTGIAGGVGPTKKNLHHYFHTPSFFSDRNAFVYCKDTLKYEHGVFDIINYYENNREIEEKGDTLVFEFTFRFTEERRANALTRPYWGDINTVEDCLN